MYEVYCDSYLLFNTDVEIENLKIMTPHLELELNKTGGFDFRIYPSHPYFNELKKMHSIITVYQDNDLIFRGRILNDQQGFYNEKQVSCEGELAFLCDSIQRPYDFQSGELHTTIADLFEFFIDNHNSQVGEDRQFIVGNVTVTDTNNYIVRADSTYMNTWDSINKKLIEIHGGYLWVRHEADGNYIDYLADFSTIGAQKIEFAKNLLDLSKITKGEDLATAIIPLGAKEENSEERLTIKSVNNDVDYVFNQDAVDAYGWIFKTVTWDDVTQASNLLSKANEYLALVINLSVSIELKAIDLAGIEDVNAFKMGTYVSVKTTPHDLDSNFLVTKLSLNLLNPESSVLTLGTTYRTFTEQTAGAGNTIEILNQKVQTVEQTYESLEVQTDTKISSEMTQMSDQIFQSVKENYYLKSETDTLIHSVSTEVTQNANEVEIKFNNFNQEIADVINNTDAEFQEIRKYIRFVDGNIILGEDGNLLTLKIQNDKISFLENGYEIAYWQNRKFYAVDGEFINSLRLGNFAFMPRANGNLSFKKVVG